MKLCARTVTLEMSYVTAIITSRSMLLACSIGICSRSSVRTAASASKEPGARPGSPPSPTRSASRQKPRLAAPHPPQRRRGNAAQQVGGLHSPKAGPAKPDSPQRPAGPQSAFDGSRKGQGGKVRPIDCRSSRQENASSASSFSHSAADGGNASTSRQAVYADEGLHASTVRRGQHAAQLRDEGRHQEQQQQLQKQMLLKKRQQQQQLPNQEQQQPMLQEQHQLLLHQQLQQVPVIPKKQKDQVFGKQQQHQHKLNNEQAKRRDSEATASALSLSILERQRPLVGAASVLGGTPVESFGAESEGFGAPLSLDGDAPSQYRQQQQQPSDPLLGLLLRAIRPLDEAGFAYCAVRRTAAWLHGVELPLRRHRHRDLGSCTGSSSSFSNDDAGADRAGNNHKGSRVVSSSGCIVGNTGGDDGEAEAGTGGSRRPDGLAAAAEVLVPELELEVQWDQMKIIHDMFGRQGAGGDQDWFWSQGPLQEFQGGEVSATFTITGGVSPAASKVGSTAGPEITAASAVSTNTSTSTNSHAGRLESGKRMGLQPPAARYVMTAAPPPPSPPPVVRVTFCCTYNTTLRARPDRVLIRPHPSPPPPPPLAVSLDATAALSCGAHGGRDGGGERCGDRGSSGTAGTEQLTGLVSSTIATGRTGSSTTATATSANAGNLARAAGCSGPPWQQLQLPSPSLAVLTTATPSGRASDGSGATTAAAAAGGSSAPAQMVWSQTLYSVATEAGRTGDDLLAAAVRFALRSLQRELSAVNTAAWGRDTAYDAWVARFGAPSDAAARLLRDPARCLGPLLPYITLPDSPPLKGLRVVNLLGSHGHKAAALAALGASVVVVDASAGNAAYARALAKAAGLGEGVLYIVGDVAELRPGGSTTTTAAVPDDGLTTPYVGEAAAPVAAAPPALELPAGQFDLVLMEMGVLHYFLDLRWLMRDVVSPLLRPGGRLLLREFHPVSTKLISSKGKKHKASGDYFSSQPLVAVDVAYSKYEELAVAAAAAAAPVQDRSMLAAADPPEHEAANARARRPTAYLRQWGLGEVVTAVCGSGRLAVRVLDEEAGPRLDDAGLPKVFTLLAECVV